jgi:hypothetical protein
MRVGGGITNACGDATTGRCLQAIPICSSRLTHLDPPQLIVVKVARGHQVILHGVHVQNLDANGGGEGRLHDGQIELDTWSGKQREKMTPTSLNKGYGVMNRSANTMSYVVHLLFLSSV